MSKLIMPGDAAAVNGLTVQQGVDNFTEIQRRINTVGSINLLPDSGRQINKSQIAENVETLGFVNNDIHNTPRNGAVIASGGKHTSNSSSYGGTQAADPQDVIDMLIAARGSVTGGHNPLWLSEFYLTQVTAGSGTDNGANGRYPTQAGQTGRIYIGSDGYFTQGFFIKVVSGTVALALQNGFDHNTNYIDNVAATGTEHVFADNDWHYCSLSEKHPNAYTFFGPFRASPGAVYLTGWKAVIPGAAKLDKPYSFMNTYGCIS